MITVQVKNGNVDGALKKFKQRVAKSGLPSEVKKKQAEEKGGVKDITAKTMDATENQPDDQKRVSINITFGNGSSASDEVNLIKVDGNWKVKM